MLSIYSALHKLRGECGKANVVVVVVLNPRPRACSFSLCVDVYVEVEEP